MYSIINIINTALYVLYMKVKRVNGEFSQEKKIFSISLILCVCEIMYVYNPMDCSLPGSSVHGILQAKIVESVARPPPGDLPNPRIKPACLTSPALAGGFFTTSTTWEAHVAYTT